MTQAVTQPTLVILVMIQVHLVTVRSASDEPCVFPFLSEGNLYNDCTDRKQDGTLWCPTTYDYSPKRKWHLCDSKSEGTWSVFYSLHSVCTLKGSSVNLSCSYIHPSYLTVKEAYWVNSLSGAAPDISHLPKYKDRVRVHCGKKHCKLHIEPVNDSDEGHFYCRITTNLEREKQTGEHGVKISVTDLNVLSSRGPVREGNNVTLTCNITCDLPGRPFIWSKDGRPVEKKQIIYNQLQLHPVSYEDEGNYTCAVRGYEHLPSPPERLGIMREESPVVDVAWLAVVVSVPVCGVLGFVCAGVWMRSHCKGRGAHEDDVIYFNEPRRRKSGAIEIRSGQQRQNPNTTHLAKFIRT